MDINYKSVRQSVIVRRSFLFSNRILHIYYLIEGKIIVQLTICHAHASSY